MKYVLVLDVAKGKSMFMLSSDAGEVLLEPTEYAHNKANLELIDSNINKLNIKDNLTVVMEATSIYHKAPERFFKENNYHVIVFNPLIGKEITNTDKKVVIGHFGTEQLRKMYPEITKNDKGNDYDILTRDDGKVIALDATTVLSKKVNVLVIEDEII